MPTRSKISFDATTYDEDGNPTVRRLAVRPPSPRARTLATMERMAAFGEAVARRIPTKDEMEAHVRRMNLWDDDKQRAYDRLAALLAEQHEALARGGIKKSKARDAALTARGATRMIVELRAPFVRAERNTADAFADQVQFETLVAHCTTFDDGPDEGRPYFTADGVEPSVDAYRERAAEEDGRAAAEAFADLYYGEVEDAPEEAFLKKYGFADADGNLVDKQGRRVDVDGNPVDEEGYLLQDSAPAPEFVEFLDDDEPEAPAEAPEPEAAEDA